MDIKRISGGTVHAVPLDLKEALIADTKALLMWEDTTPLARNEWICWVESVKRLVTRKGHVRRVCLELTEGKRRPCCWIGCVHRRDKALNPTQRFMLKKSAKKK